MPNGRRSNKRSSRAPKRKSPPRRRTRRAAPKPSGPFRSFVSNDPFRPTMSTKLHYTVNLTMSSGLGGLFGPEHIFRCNSLYDPDYTSGGHQPYGYDQLELLYRKYKVNAVAVNVTYSDPNQDGTLIGFTFQPPGGSATLAGGLPSTIEEQPMSIVRRINNTGKQVGKLKQFFPISTVSGLSKLQFGADVDLFTAATGTNPAASPLFRVAVATTQGSTSTLTVSVSLTYYCTFYERKGLPAST